MISENYNSEPVICTVIGMCMWCQQVVEFLLHTPVNSTGGHPGTTGFQLFRALLPDLQK